MVLSPKLPVTSRLIYWLRAYMNTKANIAIFCILVYTHEFLGGLILRGSLDLQLKMRKYMFSYYMLMSGQISNETILTLCFTSYL